MKQELRHEDTVLKQFKSGVIIQHKQFPDLVYILLKKRGGGVVELWDNIQNGTFYESGGFTLDEYELYKGEVVLTND